MDEREAKEWLAGMIQPDGSLYNLGRYIHWDGLDVVLDGQGFSAGELEAIAWWIRNKEITK